MSFLIYKVKTTSLLSQAIRKKETATENRSGWHTVGAQQNSGPPSPFPATLGFREPLFCSSPDSHLSPNPIVSTDQGMVRASPICLCPPQNQQQGQGQPLREVPGRAPLPERRKWALEQVGSTGASRTASPTSIPLCVCQSSFCPPPQLPSVTSPGATHAYT